MFKRYLLGFAMAALSATATVPPATSQDTSPFFLTNNNAGTEFYFSFPPSYSQGSGAEIKLFFSSPVQAEVLVEVPANGLVRNLTLEPNKVSELSLNPTVGQPYFKTANGATASDQVYSQKAIRVKSDVPIIVYGATLFQNFNDGFMFLPTSAIGQEYILTSYIEAPGFTGAAYPSEVVVAAPYDGTQVTFTLGGNLNTKTNGNGQGAGGLTGGQSKKYTLKKGDVLTISTYGTGGDLSGSKISSNKPVSVVSGHFCTKIPATISGFSFCNFLGEAELPTSAWGTACHVTKLFGRQKNSFIKVVAKEPNTKVYRNGQLIGTIQTAGGVDGKGYLDIRVAEGEAKSFIISGDKPISVTQYNTSKGDDNVSQGEPFQMVTTPVEQFQKEIYFSTLGSGSSNAFSSHYVNIVFEATSAGNIPADLKIGVVDKGNLVWQGVEDKYGSVFELINYELNGKKYGVKTVKLGQEGVYALVAETPIAAYIYNPGNDPYGCPASAGLIDRNYDDKEAPVPAYTMDQFGTIKDATVRDMPNDAVRRSNLASVYMDKSRSSNYRFTLGALAPGMSSEITWGLTAIDPTKPAEAYIVFIDRAGNDSTLKVTFDGVKTASAEVTGFDFGKLVLSNEKEGSVRITSTGNKAITVTAIDVPSSSAFTVEVPTLPFVLEPSSFQNVKVHFKPSAPGEVTGSVIFRTQDLAAAAATVKGEGIAPMLAVNNISFPATEINASKAVQLQVVNNGTEAVKITAVQGPATSVFSMNEVTLPVQINAKESFTTTVQFKPTEEGEFSDEVHLYVMDYEVRATLQGVGITVATVSVGEADIAAPVALSAYPNPADNVLTLSYTMPTIAHARLVLCNILGHEVQVLADGLQQAGHQTVPVASELLAPGVYFCRLTVGGVTSTVAVTIVH